MASITPQYEFETHAYEHATGELPHLEKIAQKLRAHCTARSIYGMHEYRLDSSTGNTVLDQPHPDDQEFAEGVLASANIDNPSVVEAITANIVTGADNYNSYLRSNRGTLFGNFHADPRIVYAEGRVLFLPPRAGRLAISLFDDGVFGVEGVVTTPVSRLTHYTCHDPTRRPSRYYEEMRNRKQTIIGEQKHFLRGPLNIEEFAEKYSAQRQGPEQWRYWDLGYIHRGGEVVRPGRTQIVIDFKLGHDPFQIDS